MFPLILHFNFYLCFCSYTLACFTSCGSNTEERKFTSQINYNYHRFISSELRKAWSARAHPASLTAHHIYPTSLLTCTWAWKYPLWCDK